MLTKLICLGIAILIISLVEVAFEKTLKIDLSSVSRSDRVIHDVIQTLGGITMAIVWYIA